jgi:hypothetical protein
MKKKLVAHLAREQEKKRAKKKKKEKKKGGRGSNVQTKDNTQKCKMHNGGET